MGDTTPVELIPEVSHMVRGCRSLPGQCGVLFGGPAIRRIRRSWKAVLILVGAALGGWAAPAARAPAPPNNVVIHYDDIGL
jgi:hypothetical protein